MSLSCTAIEQFWIEVTEPKQHRNPNHLATPALTLKTIPTLPDRSLLEKTHERTHQKRERRKF